jgi:hypothetical protein
MDVFYGIVPAEGIAMLNIEIHGCLKGDGETLYLQTERLLRAEPFAEELVISVVGDVVRDIKGYRKPFFRIFYIREVQANRVIELLRPLGLDYELSPLLAFVRQR